MKQSFFLSLHKDKQTNNNNKTILLFFCGMETRLTVSLTINQTINQTYTLLYRRVGRLTRKTIRQGRTITEEGGDQRQDMRIEEERITKKAKKDIKTKLKRWVPGHHLVGRGGSGTPKWLMSVSVINLPFPKQFLLYVKVLK